MIDTLLDWLHLILRWAHVVAGIMWIGQTYLFNWMERAMTAPQDINKKNISGELWMVHGGGFYLVEKQKWPELMPRTLHWFKWESGLTWITGFLLLSVVYWMGSPLVDYGSEISQAQGIAISLGFLILGWVLYNAIWRSPLGKQELAGAALSWVLIVAAGWALSHWLSQRAVYLHIGAMFGTIMSANVWMVIIPSQKKIMAITEQGGTPDHSLSAKAKRASKHNTFMSVPVVFLMISNHYPFTFGSEMFLTVLGVLVIGGWIAAKLIRDHA